MLEKVVGFLIPVGKVGFLGAPGSFATGDIYIIVAPTHCLCVCIFEFVYVCVRVCL